MDFLEQQLEKGGEVLRLIKQNEFEHKVIEAYKIYQTHLRISSIFGEYIESELYDEIDLEYKKYFDNPNRPKI